MWHMTAGASDGAPGTSSRAGEGPDVGVRLDSRWSKAIEPYDPTPARRCGCQGLTPPEAASRTADGGRGRTGKNVRDRLAALLLGRDPVHPRTQW
ncbi:hypothetical protein [Actinomadura alba]|uniref:Uncharacterized protein n=1 Tax=Actinomadura alba TaxID=406431 RepID=A0ABR7LP76_9ACTN|nr:hypothetical protein [Actinomadura alba]MBC6466658.1 hypothetical protein [Actinomadura alba]